MTTPAFDFGTIQRAPAGRPGLDLDPLIRVLLAKRQDENSKAANDLMKQRLALDIAKEKTEQAKVEHEREVAGQSGNVAQVVVEFLAEGGHLESMLREAGVIPPAQLGATAGGRTMTAAGAPGAPATPEATASGGALPAGMPPEMLARFKAAANAMSPEARQLFARHTLPALFAFPQSVDAAPGEGADDQVVQTGKYVTTYRKGKGYWNPETKTWEKSLARGLSQDVLDANEKKFRERMTAKFDARTKDLRDRSRILAQTALTLHAARFEPDPANRRALQSSAVANFVQGADQKAQIRIEMLRYFRENVAGGHLLTNWRILRDRLLKGTFPDEVIEGMARHIESLQKLNRVEYESIHNAELKKHPELGTWLSNADEFFDVALPAQLIDVRKASGGAAQPARGSLTPLPEIGGAKP